MSDLKPVGGMHISNFGAVPGQFQEHGGLKGMAKVCFSRPVKNRNQAGVDGVYLAGIHSPPPFGEG